MWSCFCSDLLQHQEYHRLQNDPIANRTQQKKELIAQFKCYSKTVTTKREAILNGKLFQEPEGGFYDFLFIISLLWWKIIKNDFAASVGAKRWITVAFPLDLFGPLHEMQTGHSTDFHFYCQSKLWTQRLVQVNMWVVIWSSCARLGLKPHLRRCRWVKHRTRAMLPCQWGCWGEPHKPDFMFTCCFHLDQLLLGCVFSSISNVLKWFFVL